MSSWFLYMVECADGTLYTGVTNDVDRRLEAHNTGRGARYTRGRRPVRMVYLDELPDRSMALRAEHALKRLSRAEKQELVDEGRYS